MRAILLLLIVGAAGCGSNGDTSVELDIGVDAPGAASVVIDGTHTLPATGGVYTIAFSSLAAAMSAHGAVQTVNSDGSERASATYELGSYCSAETPLARETLHFVETNDASGNPALGLDSVECEKSDGTGVIVTP